MDFSRYFENAENYRPMKEGRLPQAMVQNQLEPAKVRNKDEAAKKRLEYDLTGDDPLGGWVNYIRTLKELHPSGGTIITKALEEAAVCFRDVDRFKNDPRLLNIFIELADKQSDPRDTFNYMKLNHIGEELTNFHLAMAAVFERAKDYDIAEKCYSEAVNVAKRRNVATEFDLAMKHLTHYKRRSARRLQEARAVHGPSSPQTNRALRVAVSAAEQHARHQQQLPPPSARAGLGGAAPGGSLASTKRPVVGMTAPRAPQFNIYEDRRMGSARQTRPADAVWHNLETENTAVENQGPAIAWSEAGTVRSQRPVPAIRPPSFTIWTEPSDQGPVAAVEEVANQMEQMQISSEASRTPMVVSNVPATAPAPSVAPSTPPSNHQDDRTINTRMALNDMFEMFASPSMSVARPAAPAPLPIYTPAIGLATRLAEDAEAEDDEKQNVSPNVVLPPGETGATMLRSTMRRPLSARPPLAVIEHHEDSMSPDFRRELTNPPPYQQEGFRVFQDTPAAAPRGLAPRTVDPRTVQPMRMQHQQQQVHGQSARDPMDETADGGTLGISRVLAFDQVQTHTVARPRTTRMMASTTKPAGVGGLGFQIFQD